jgi:hypothetical protein
MTSEIVVANFYALRDPVAFDRSARLLVTRLRLMGQDGLRSYRFLGQGPNERRLVAVYEGPEAWVGLHDQILTWPETVALRAAARLVRTDLYGPIPPPVIDWIPRLGLGRMVRHNNVPVAGYPDAFPAARPAPIRFAGNVGRRAG